MSRAALGEPVVLGIGDSVEVSGENLRVSFKAVEMDSRCPAGVTCIWEGVATVVVAAEKGSERRQELVLATTNRRGYSTRSEYLGYEIELLDLAPPKSPSTRESDYRVTLVVRAK